MEQRLTASRSLAAGGLRAGPALVALIVALLLTLAPALLAPPPAAAQEAAELQDAAGLQESDALERTSTLRVTPLVLDVTANPGDTVPLTIQVQNAGTEPALLFVHAGDWHRTEEGRHRFLPPGTLERSASGWIQLAPREFQLAPGEQRAVRLTVTVPEEGFDGTHWSMVFIEPQARPVMRGGSAVRIVSRIGVHLYVTPAHGGRRDGVVEEVRATYAADRGEVEVEAVFANTGNIPVEPEGWARLINASGEVVSQVSIPDFPVLPGDRHRFRVALPADLEPGRYAVVAAFDYQDVQMVGGQAFIEVGP